MRTTAMLLLGVLLLLGLIAAQEIVMDRMEHGTEEFTYTFRLTLHGAVSDSDSFGIQYGQCPPTGGCTDIGYAPVLFCGTPQALGLDTPEQVERCQGNGKTYTQTIPAGRGEVFSYSYFRLPCEQGCESEVFASGRAWMNRSRSAAAQYGDPGNGKASVSEGSVSVNPGTLSQRLVDTVLYLVISINPIFLLVLAMIGLPALVAAVSREARAHTASLPR